jgi:hypothetical protein
VQIDPKAAQVVMETPSGSELSLNPGKQLVARVVEAAQDGAAKISLAGQILAVQSNVPLHAGDEIRLSVTQASATTVQLSVLPSVAAQQAPPSTLAQQPAAMTGPPAVATAPMIALPSQVQAQTQQQSGQQHATPQHQLVGPQAVIAELAKLGVPVDPTVADAVARVVEHLGGGTAATRAVAQLASRDLVLSSAAATRVAAALEVAGKLAPQLDHLAANVPAVAAALPTSAPSAAALRNVLAPVLEPAELAIARIVQSGEPAAKIAGAASSATAPVTEAASAALRGYASAKLAAAASSAGAPLHLESAVSRPHSAPGAQAAASEAQASATRSSAPPPPVGAPASQAQQAMRAALVGTSATPPTAGAEAAENVLTTPGASPAERSGPGALLQRGGTDAAAAAPRSLATNDPAALPLAAQRTSVSAASAAAATGTATAIATPTSAPVADAVADLATMAARIAPSAGPAQGAAAEAASHQSQGSNAVQTAQNAGAAGAAGTAAASATGAAASGDPRPIVTAVSQFLASGGSDAERAALLRTLVGADKATIAAAVRQLPEDDALRFAGAMLESLPSADAAVLRGGADAHRHDVHRALDDLGRALAHATHGATDELASLRSALQQTASTDARPAVAHDAARLLGALDGQQVLSRTQTGADAGFLYFQVPLPDGRGAEVVVRRDPARRAVSFDEFNIAFLLDTEQLGTLMIQLDAHPAGIRADVKTDIPSLQPFLEAQTDALVEPLARESRRPVTVSVGSFDSAPPASLLEPQLGLVAPGMTEYYV